MKKTIQKFAFGVLLATGLTTSVSAQWQTVGTGAFTTDNIEWTHLKFSNTGEPYVAYQGSWQNGYKATVMKFDGTNWVNVGPAEGFSEGQASGSSLSFAFSFSGEPHVAYLDNANGYKATVMKFDGTDWVNVGPEGFAGYNSSISLSFQGDTPYVAFRDNENGDKATIMKFDGTDWVTVGTAGFSAGVINSNPSLAYSANNGVHLAYTDGGNSNKATVVEFDGTDWVAAGTAGFSDGTANNISLAIYGGIDYVAYTDGAHSDKITVMKLNGTNWEIVGNAGFSAGGAIPKLAFSPNGIPYVVYRDITNAQKATVMKFDGTNWVAVGGAGFTNNIANNPSIAFNPLNLNEEPYISYSTNDDASGPGYVLKFVDATSGVNDIVLNNVTAVYPNPANSIINVVATENTNITIVNVLGAVVATQNLQTGKNTVDVSTLTNGVYFIQTANGGAVKFIKE